MKNRKTKLIAIVATTLLLVLGFAFSVFANESANYWVAENMQVDTYRATTDADGKYTTAPTKEGYVFAGWFTDEACTEVFTGTTGTAYAKFVPAGILTVKAQVGGNLIDDDLANDDDGGAIRFVTTIDSTDYSAIGFEVYYNGATTDPYISPDTTTVYTHLYSVGEHGTGEPVKHDPTVFNENSKYFKTLTFTELPATEFAKSLEAKPFWVTLDGTKVVAEGGVRCVNEGRKYLVVDEDSTGGVGTINMPYGSFDDAMALAVSENKVATEDIDAIVYLNTDVTVNQEIEMDYNKRVMIQSDGPVTITRGEAIVGDTSEEEGKGGRNVFDVSTGTLSIQGTANGRITIEGNTVSEGVRSTEANVRAFAVRDGALLDMDYVTVQNFTRNGSGGGVAIGEVGSEMNFNYCTFDGNYALSGGGALYFYNDSLVTSTNCAYTNNECPGDGSGNGGAINCRGTYNDTNSTYTGNNGKNGGAIAVMKHSGAEVAGSITISGATFTENEAASNGNAIFLNSGGCAADVSGSSFVDNAYVYNDGTKNTNKPHAVYVTSGATATHKDNTYTKTSSTLQQTVNVQGTIDSNDLEAKIGKIYYPAFTTAFSAAANNATIVLLEDANVGSQQQINAVKAVTITCEKPVTLTNTGSGSNMFDVRGGGTLTIQGKDENNMITLEGSGSEKNTRAATVRGDAELVMKYVTVQNFYKTGTNQWGAAIYTVANTNGQATVENCIFKSNYAQIGGGAINVVAGASVTCKNSIFENNSTGSASGYNGGAVRSLGTYVDENNTYINNAGQNGGAVAIMGGTATLDGKGTGKFLNNSSFATNNSNAVFLQTGTTANVTGYTFEGYEPATISVTATDETATTLNFNNLQGARIVMANDTNSILNATGTDNLDKVVIVPATYEVGKTILTVEEGTTEAAYDNVQVAASNGSWRVDEAGLLQQDAVAATVLVDGADSATPYATLDEAIEAAKATKATVTVLRNSQIAAAHTITGDVTIVNAAGKTVNMERATNTAVLFTISAGGTLTLGKDDTTNGDQLVLDAFTATTATKRLMANKGTFNLKANAVITHTDWSNATAWGSVLINQGTTAIANLNGTIAWNQTHSDNAAAGILLNHTTATMNITGGSYTNNSSVGANTNGGLLYVQTGKVVISGGTFVDNYAGSKGAVAYVVSPGELEITSGTYSNNLASTFFNNGGTMTYMGEEKQEAFDPE